jgi:hypothetical protein
MEEGENGLEEDLHVSLGDDPFGHADARVYPVGALDRLGRDTEHREQPDCTFLPIERTWARQHVAQGGHAREHAVEVAEPLAVGLMRRDAPCKMGVKRLRDGDGV